MQGNTMVVNTVDRFLKNLSIFCFLIFPAALVAGPFAAELSMNTVSIIFLYNVFRKKDFFFCKQKFFLIFILFYTYLLLSSFFSEYVEEILYKNLFYFRFIIFVCAVFDLLLNNETIILLFYKILLLTLFLVAADAYVQYLFGSNLIGYTQIREDRVAGLFGDKLILGSYLARLFPLLIGLFFYNLKLLKFREIAISVTVIIICLIMIVISGERMALIGTLIYCAAALTLVDFYKKIKVIIFFLILAIISLMLILQPNLYNRHYQQTIDQFNFKFDNKNFFSNFLYYAETYETAFAGFLDKKIIGQGPKSFRLFCANTKFIYEKETKHSVTMEGLLDVKKIIIDNVFVEINNSIKKGDILFTYRVNKESINYIAQEDMSVLSTNINKDLIGKSVDTKGYFIYYKQHKNGCTTHPHNFYLQLLSETGIVGFSFIFLIFSYFVYLMIKCFYFTVFKKRKLMSNLQISLALGFIITLLPIIPNGNFFNNWLNMIMILPVGFYIFATHKNNS
jgi:O-antigen ligase